MSRQAEVIEVNRGYLDHFRRWARLGSSRGGTLFDRLMYGWPAQLLFLPLLPFLVGLIAARLLLWRVLTTPRALPTLHAKALDFVDEFVEQYPWHLYPVVAKSLELAFLRDRIASDGTKKILEIAIGDGTLSRRVFNPTHQITGIDLSPYDLVKAAKLPHVRRAIVCDGLNPPFADFAFDLLVANNFLHHVTQKRLVLSNWRRHARRLIFTENTIAWANGWTVPYLLRRLGLKRLADYVAHRIERRSLQSLLTMEEITKVAEAACPITERQSFLSERTFFYCGVFSFGLRCFGPPTPALFKRLALGPLRPVVMPSTRWIARLLIEFDAFQDRRNDSFLEFVCDNPTPGGFEGQCDIVCPACRIGLSEALRCLSCGEHYSTRNGMIFVLPHEFGHVLQDFTEDLANAIPAEHL